MVTYTVKNTANATVATINTASTTGNTFPIELLGQGISLYGPIIAQNEYRHLENFALATAPTNPVNGMFWYKSDIMIPHFYNGTEWVALSTARNSSSTGFPMLPAASNIDLTVTGTTTIFQAPGTSERFHPTSIILLPNGVISASSPATFNLYISSSEDIRENDIVRNMSGNTHSYFTIEGTTRFATGSETIKFDVTQAATGGSLSVSVLMFGLIT